jgi:copper chaperone CopZ
VLASLEIIGMAGGVNARRVQCALEELAGVAWVGVLPAQGFAIAIVRFDPDQIGTDALTAAVKVAGCRVERVDSFEEYGGSPRAAWA